MNKRLTTVDALRGIAAFAVVWYHFTMDASNLYGSRLLQWSGAYGYLGVEAFFVISGFVIPYSLSRANYSLRGYPRFLGKRIVRLDPPYLASIVIVLVVGYIISIMPGYRGEPFRLSVPQLALHFGYANVFFGYNWLNVVYWSLAIELQYYLLVGLAFPLVSTARFQIERVIACVALITLAFLVPSTSFLPHYAFLFLLGISTFRYRNRLLGKASYLCLLAAFGLGAYVTLGIPEAIAGTATALIIAFVQVQSTTLNFLGLISYSLYLIHVPIGLNMMAGVRRATSSPAIRMTGLVLSLGLVLVSAYVLYKVVEKPAQRWSGRMRYQQRANADFESLAPELQPNEQPAL